VIEPAALTPFVAATPSEGGAVRAADADALRPGDCLTPRRRCWPGLKELIRELFQQVGQVVLPPETLAACIQHCPARTTVISALSTKPSGATGRCMGSEFLQMAGRAGAAWPRRAGLCRSRIAEPFRRGA